MKEYLFIALLIMLNKKDIFVYCLKDSFGEDYYEDPEGTEM
jgi:hypothetical protein